MRQDFRQLVYSLSKHYGTSVLITEITQSIDRETGVITESNTSYTINKFHAVLLPETLQRDFAYDLSYIAANKNFTYGGLFIQGSRLLIMDTRQEPDLVLSDSMNITINAIVYTVKQIVKYDTTQYAVILTQSKGKK
jgi:hypothetical protein